MAKTAVINVRVDKELKEAGEAVLREIGLSKSDLISMTFRQLVLQRGLPFEAKIPKDETLEAMREVRDPEFLRNAKRYRSASQIIDQIDS